MHQPTLTPVLIAAALCCSVATSALAMRAPGGLTAEAHDSRVDLVWDRVSDTDLSLWNIYRADDPAGPWYRLNERPHAIHVYSDFTGCNDQTFYYRVTRVEVTGMDTSTHRLPGVPGLALGAALADVSESAPSDVVEATPFRMSEDELLDSVQKAFFRYFWDFGHPVSGLSREGFTHPRDTCTTGGTGFGMITIMVGADRGFVSREQAAQRLLTMVTFLEDKATRYHGMWPHHVNGATGETLPFDDRYDNGADIVESAFLLQGMLTVREYFDSMDPVEAELRDRITRLWQEADWTWFQQPGDKHLTWHWSPDYGFKMNHKVDGPNECQIVYLLAMASPTHAISPDSYYRGWAWNPERYMNGKSYFGIKQPIGWPRGGPLFFTHYSFLGLDPRKVTDAYANYFQANRAISLINRAYCIENPKGYAGYSDRAWGLTASFNPEGYCAQEPNRDNGTITPTAAISAMPYTPTESLAALRHFYHDLGPQVWGAFGFRDAFNPNEEWVSDTFLAIDQGTMAPMIENYRTGLPWDTFMRSDVAVAMLDKLAEARPSARLPKLARTAFDAYPRR